MSVGIVLDLGFVLTLLLFLVLLPATSVGTLLRAATMLLALLVVAAVRVRFFS